MLRKQKDWKINFMGSFFILSKATEGSWVEAGDNRFKIFFDLLCFSWFEHERKKKYIFEFAYVPFRKFTICWQNSILLVITMIELDFTVSYHLDGWYNTTIEFNIYAVDKHVHTVNASFLIGHSILCFYDMDNVNFLKGGVLVFYAFTHLLLFLFLLSLMAFFFALSV